MLLVECFFSFEFKTGAKYKRQKIGSEILTASNSFLSVRGS